MKNTKNGFNFWNTNGRYQMGFWVKSDLAFLMKTMATNLLNLFQI